MNDPDEPDLKTRTDSPGIVLYDQFHRAGGAERVTVELCKALDGCEVCVGQREASVMEDVPPQARTIVLRRGPIVRGLSTIRVMRAFEKNSRFIDRYDWVLFSGVLAPLAITNRRSSRNYYYCHTPPRFLYDLRDHYTKALGFPYPQAVGLLDRVFKPRYESSVQAMDRVIANSATVQRRLLDHLGAESTVVHPPCDTSRFRYHETGDFYLSTARLEPYKNVDRIIEAFKLLPEKTLVVASGGTEYRRLKRRARGYPNIRFTGWTTDRKLRDLLSRCIAVVYVPTDEDFGMSPVESMASGKPVIGVRSGGLKETVLAEETGFLLDENPSPAALAKSIARMSPRRARAMRRACEIRAGDFDSRRFQARIRDIIFGDRFY